MNLNNKKLIIILSTFVLLGATTFVFAANPIAPFLPSDNVQDPGNPTTAWGGCLPSDPNCYVTSPAALVTSVFGRIGDVISVVGDYVANQITNTPSGNIAATNVQDAINELDTEKESVLTFSTGLTRLVNTISLDFSAFPDASETVRGFVNTVAQTFGGNKTFTGSTLFSNILTTISSGVAGNSGLRITGLTSSPILATNALGDIITAPLNPANGIFWGLTGNSETNPTTNFIGTTDNQPLAIRTNNLERVRILNNGNVGIGKTNPTALLDVNGDAIINGHPIGRGLGNSIFNVVFGNGSFSTNTSGIQNVVIGVASMQNNTTGNDNFALGSFTVRMNTTGSRNVGIGNSTLRDATTASRNIGIGSAVLQRNLLGDNNVGIGDTAGTFDSTNASVTNVSNSIFLGRNTKPLGNSQTNQIVIGDNAVGLGSNTVVLGNDSVTTTALRGNVGIGTTTPTAKLDIHATSSLATHQAFRVRNSTNTRDFLVVNGTGDVYNNGASGIISNTFFGENVGRVTTGSFNTFIGNNAGGLNTTGSSNVGIGRNALLANTTGATNTAIGSGAMSSNTTGGINVAIGALAMSGNTTGSNNIAIGLDALKSNTTSSGSIGVGRDALRNSTGSNNVGLGQNSMLGLLTGASNFAMGVNSGRFIGSSGTTPLTISNNSIFLGFNTRALVNNSNNEIVIGASAMGLGSNTVVLGNNSITTTALRGNVGIGINSPAAQLHTTGTVRFQNFGAGTMQTDVNGNVTVSSDEKLKKITSDFNRGIEDVLNINPINYFWTKESGFDTATEYSGFSAQNIKFAIPEAIDTDSRGYLTLSDRPILAASINSIKGLALAMTDESVELENKNGRTFAGKFFDRLSLWLGNTKNQISQIFAKRITASEEICIGERDEEICITKEDLKIILNNNSIEISDQSQDNTQENNNNVEEGGLDSGEDASISLSDSENTEEAIENSSTNDSENTEEAIENSSTNDSENTEEAIENSSTTDTENNL